MKIAPFALRRTAIDTSPGMPRLFSAGALLMTLCLTACGSGGGGSAAGHDLLADNAQTSQSSNAANNGTGVTSTSGGNASNSANNPAGGAGAVSTPQPLNGQAPLGDNSASVRPLAPANDPGSTSAQPSAGSNGANADSAGASSDASTSGTPGQSGNTNNAGNAGSSGSGNNASGSGTPGHGNANAGQPPVNNETPAVKPGDGAAGGGTAGDTTTTPGTDGNVVTPPVQPAPQPNPTDSPANGHAGTGTNPGPGNNTTPSNQLGAAPATPYTPPAPVGTQDPSPLCAPILAKAQQLTSGTTVGDMPSTPRPAIGVATEDPTWHSCVVRLTKHAETQPAHPVFTPHAAQQAFNADDSALLLRTDHGEWQIFDPKTSKSIRKLDKISGDAEPQWDPKNPNVLYYLNVDGKDMKIFRLTVDLSPNGTDKAELLADMSVQIHQHWPTATHARTRGGTPSDDSRTWCFMAERNEGSSWNTLGLFTWDLQTGKIIGTQSLPPGSPEYITTSPSGSHCVAQFPYPTGVLAYKRDFSAPYSAQVSGNSLKLLNQGYQKYGDVARNAQGQDMYVGFDVFSDPHQLFMTNLVTGEKTTLLTTSFGANTDTGVQVSGRAMQRPGWVLVSGFGERKDGVNNLAANDPNRKWFHRKMFALSLENPPKVLSIANLHHLWDGSKNETWPRPHGTVNRSFTRMLFNSNWDSVNLRDLDTYLVEIRSDAVPALHTPKP